MEKKASLKSATAQKKFNDICGTLVPVPLFHKIFNDTLSEFCMENGFTPLHWAAKNGNLNIVKYLVDEKKIDVNVSDKMNNTPLHLAAENGMLSIVTYLAGEKNADLNIKNKYGQTPLYLAAKNNHLATVKYLKEDINIFPFLDAIDYILKIVNGVLGILDKFGVLSSSESKDFEKVFHDLDRNYDAIKGVGDKVDRNFAAMKAVYEIAQETLFDIEKTRYEMLLGIQHVLDSVTGLRVDDKVSKINSFMRDFFTVDILIINELSREERYLKLKELSKDITTSGGVLHDNLNEIIEQGLAIPNPNSAGDSIENNLRFSAFDTVYYGTQVCISVVFFVIEQYSYLAGDYYQAGEIEKYNELYGLLEAQFDAFKGSLSNDGSIIDRVSNILTTVQNLTLVRNERKDIFELIPDRIASLSLAKEKLKHMVLPQISTKPSKIMGVPDFSKSNVTESIGQWRDGVKVSYAMQYRRNNTYSQVSEWSDPVEIHGKANPYLTIPAAGEEGRERLIFRKFDNGKAELVGVMKEKDVSSFRDISRDVYDAALSSVEDRAREEIKILLANHADVNERFDNGRKAIHAAAQSNNINIMLDLLRLNKTDINEQDVNGYTPIYIAAEAGYGDFVKFLLDHGADSNIKINVSNLTLTPLHIAAYKGYFSVVETLMESNKTDINTKDKDEFTPLHSAAFSDSLPTVYALLNSSNCDVNAKSKEGLTPLHLTAINKRHVDVSKVLLQSNRVDVNSKAKGNYTALHFAVSIGNVEVSKVLIKHKETDINAKSANDFTPLHLATSLKNENIMLELLNTKEIEVNVKCKGGITPLHIAAVTGQTSVTSTLLEKGAMKEAKTKDGLTPLHSASMYDKHEVITILLDSGANIEATTVNGSTPLHLASSAGSSNSTLLLLDRSADTRKYDNKGQMPIHLAVLRGKTDTMKILINHELSLANVTNKNGEYPIHLAAETDYVDVIDCLFDYKVDIDVRNNAGDTPLHYAAKNDKPYAIKTLADKGADSDFKDNSGWAPLHWAARYNYPNAIFAFAEKKANLTIRNNDSFTPLHLAAIYNCPNATTTFADVGADLNVIDNNGSTPLHLACKNNHLDTVQCLVEKRAKVNVRDKFSLIPLHLAAKNGYFNISKYLVERGANITAATTGKNNIDAQFGYTSLHYAVRSGVLDIVKYLINKGADVEATTSDKDTPLHLAAEDGYLDMVKYLVNNQNATVNAKNNVGRSPLHWAAIKGHSDIIKYLIDKKADVNAKELCGMTPLHHTIENGNLDTVKYLIEKGADFRSPINTPGSYYNGYTCLYFAVVSVHLDILKYFVEEKKEVDLNIKYSCQFGFCQTALHFATGVNYPGYPEIAEYLIEKGADVNIRNNFGRTPLYEAAKNGPLYIVKSLVDHNAEVNVRDKDGWTPLRYASGYGHPDIEKYLESKGALRSYQNIECKKLSKKTKVSKKNDNNDKKDNNEIIRGTSRLSPWGNIFVHAKNVSQFIYSPCKPSIDMKNSQPFKSMTIQSTDVNGMLLLLDTFIWKITGQKYISTEDQPASFPEMQVCALSIIDQFEKVLKYTAKKSGISIKDIDFFEVYLDIEGHIRNGTYSQIPCTLYSAIEKACPKCILTDKFIDILRDNMEIIR